MDPLTALRDAARQALAAHDALGDAFRALDRPSAYAAMTPEDLELMCKLVISRIDPLNGFAAVVQLRPDVAGDLLISRYVGKGVSPDTKFGGFLFELSTMIDDLYEAGGEPALRALVAHPRFDHDRLADWRVAEAFAAALDLASDELPDWLRPTE